jgi:aldose 1-epimerase
MRAPTGTQYVISRATPAGPAEAVITQVAASLRSFTIGGTALTEPYDVDSTPPFGDGIVLVPWPNRVEDGAWELDGVAQQLDITEPARGNALHGLLRYAPYTLIPEPAGADSSAVTLGATVFPQHGYPFLLETTVRYELVEDGITVTHTIRNDGALPAPVAVGTHPFLRIGDVPTEELTLTLNAATRFVVDARLNPTAEIPVDGTDYDLRHGLVIGDRFFDDAFGGVEHTAGVARHRLTAPDGRTLELWQDENCGYVQVFTTPIFPKNGGTGTGTGTAVAVEPMTAPPNALRTGQSLHWLAPGESWSVSWGLTYSGDSAAR